MTYNGCRRALKVYKSAAMSKTITACIQRFQYKALGTKKIKSLANMTVNNVYTLDYNALLASTRDVVFS